MEFPNPCSFLATNAKVIDVYFVISKKNRDFLFENVLKMFTYSRFNRNFFLRIINMRNLKINL